MVSLTTFLNIVQEFSITLYKSVDVTESWSRMFANKDYKMVYTAYALWVQTVIFNVDLSVYYVFIWLPRYNFERIVISAACILDIVL
jgi:hypothetical protein